MKIIIIILLAFLIIYYVNKLNIVNSVKDKINIFIFDILSIIFMGFFIYYSINSNLNNGLFTTFIIWCLFVIATPIPEACLIILVPAKNFLNIDLDITQIFVSFFVLLFVFYSYYNYNVMMKTSSAGRFLIKIIDSKFYSIFITCIISSIVLAYLLNKLIDYIVFKKKINTKLNIVYFIFLIIPFTIYFIKIKELLQTI
jgi:hypothetical protein